MKFKMRDKVKDKITGFEGIILAISEYDTGCTHYGVASQDLDKDGKVKEWEWFDTSRLVLVYQGKSGVDDDFIRTGGPSQNPPQY